MTLQTQAYTLEAERDAIHAEDTRLNEQRRAQAERIHRLFLRWAMLYPHSSRREFVTWVGYGEYHSRLKTRTGTQKTATIKRPGGACNTPGHGAEIGGPEAVYITALKRHIPISVHQPLEAR